LFPYASRQINARLSLFRISNHQAKPDVRRKACRKAAEDLSATLPWIAGVPPTGFAAKPFPHPLAAGTAAFPGWQLSSDGSLILSKT
jgi:hypothetical protein